MPEYNFSVLVSKKTLRTPNSVACPTCCEPRLLPRPCSKRNQDFQHARDHIRQREHRGSVQKDPPFRRCESAPYLIVRNCCGRFRGVWKGRMLPATSMPYPPRPPPPLPAIDSDIYLFIKNKKFAHVHYPHIFMGRPVVTMLHAP